jgi:hypothetical protein
MNIKDLSKPLSVDEIDFRIQSINNGKYATILAYKDARADMNRLDEVCGALGWKREHLNDNKNCIVSIWSDGNKQWVSKEDTGTESNTEKEKGLASDSFKRACFNWGIGRELYDYPIIQIKLNDDEVQETGRDKPKYAASYNLNLRNWKWATHFEEGKLKGLACKDDKGKLRFKWGEFPKKGDKKTIIDFEAMVKSVKDGAFTVEELAYTYDLTLEQLAVLNESKTK